MAQQRWSDEPRLPYAYRPGCPAGHESARLDRAWPRHGEAAARDRSCDRGDRLEGGETIPAATTARLHGSAARPEAKRRRGVYISHRVAGHAPRRARLRDQPDLRCEERAAEAAHALAVDDRLDEMERNEEHERRPRLSLRASARGRVASAAFHGHDRRHTGCRRTTESLIHVEYGKGLKDVIERGKDGARRKSRGRL